MPSSTGRKTTTASRKPAPKAATAPKKPAPRRSAQETAGPTTRDCRLCGFPGAEPKEDELWVVVKVPKSLVRNDREAALLQAQRQAVSGVNAAARSIRT